MAQTTQQSVLDASGAQFLVDINAILAALFSGNSGPTAPTVTVGGQVWYDTTADALKVRNAANTAWITISGATISSLLGLSLVQGDLLYAPSAGAVARLPKPTVVGQLLGFNAGLTAPEWVNLFGASSLTFPNGFIRLPGNLHIMWCQFTAAGNASTTFSYSTINAGISLSVGSGMVVSAAVSADPTRQDNPPGVTACTTTGFTVYSAINEPIPTFAFGVGV